MALQRNNRDVLVDTGAWIAIQEKKDAWHSKSTAIYKSIKRNRLNRVTIDGVITETLTRLRYDWGFRAAQDFHAVTSSAVSSGTLRILWSTPDLYAAAWSIMKKFHDHRLSFVDCLLAAHAEAQNIRTIFTNDKDFEVMGFTKASVS